MHYRPPQSNFRGGGHVPRVPRGVYAYGFRRTPLFLKSTGNASEVSISFTLRLILSMLSA